HGPLPTRVPRNCRILPLGLQSAHARPAEMGHGSVAHQDVSTQTPNISAENVRQVQGRMGRKRHDSPRVTRGHPTRGKEASDSDLGRHLTAMGYQSNPKRSTSTPNDGALRTGKETPRPSVRAMWR